MRTLFLSLILTLVFGGALTASAQTTQQVTLRLNKQAKISRGKLTIKFVSVEDSRCPQDVKCVWAGNAKVTVKVTNSKGKSQTFDLNSNIQPQSVTFDGYEFKLGEVTPHPRSNVRLNPNGYTATIIVRRL
jgi:sulfate adenylyltransferase subunit 1 (EFTu-like GTPase family)